MMGVDSRNADADFVHIRFAHEKSSCSPQAGHGCSIPGNRLPSQEGRPHRRPIRDLIQFIFHSNGHPIQGPQRTPFTPTAGRPLRLL